jgi:hypothetical protein
VAKLMQPGSSPSRRIISPMARCSSLHSIKLDVVKSWGFALSNSSAARVQAMSPIALPTARGRLVTGETQAVGESIHDFDPGEVLSESEEGARQGQLVSGVATEICEKVVVPYIVDPPSEVIYCRKEGSSVPVELLAGCQATVVSFLAGVPDNLSEGKREAHEGGNQRGDDGDCHGISRRVADLLVKQESPTGPQVGDLSPRHPRRPATPRRRPSLNGCVTRLRSGRKQRSQMPSVRRLASQPWTADESFAGGPSQATSSGMALSKAERTRFRTWKLGGVSPPPSSKDPVRHEPIDCYCLSPTCLRSVTMRW